MSHDLTHDLTSLKAARDWLKATAEGGAVHSNNGGICFNLEIEMQVRGRDTSGYKLCSTVFQMMGYGDDPYPLGGVEAFDREFHERTLWKGDKRRKFCAEMVPHVERLIKEQEHEA